MAGCTSTGPTCACCLLWRGQELVSAMKVLHFPVRISCYPTSSTLHPPELPITMCLVSGRRRRSGHLGRAQLNPARPRSARGAIRLRQLRIPRESRSRYLDPSSPPPHLAGARIAGMCALCLRVRRGRAAAGRKRAPVGRGKDGVGGDRLTYNVERRGTQQPRPGCFPLLMVESLLRDGERPPHGVRGNGRRRHPHRGQPIPTLPPAIKGSRVEGREVRDIKLITRPAKHC